MAYNIRKNWASSIDIIIKKPIVILPFIIIAFLETLALELIYFFPIKPISYIANPIISKFFGEAFIHYPGNLLILPKLSYYSHLLIYAVCGVLLTAISVNIFKNIKAGITLKTKVLVKNAFKRYPAFLAYGLILAVIVILAGRMSRLGIFSEMSPLALTLILFFLNVIIHTFLILAIPLIVIKKKSLFKALAVSISLAWRNFISIFGLLILPFLVYLPIAILKTYSVKLIDKTTPEMNLYLTALGIIMAIFLDCFIFVCAAQFLLDNKEYNTDAHR